MSRLKQLIKKRDVIRTCKDIKVEIVIYKSTIDRAKDLLNKLEDKESDPIIDAKRMFRILESLYAIKNH